jgi:hypothetical protein
LTSCTFNWLEASFAVDREVSGARLAAKKLGLLAPDWSRYSKEGRTTVVRDNATRMMVIQIPFVLISLSTRWSSENYLGFFQRIRS